MRQPLVAGNWKMHGSRAENARAHRGDAERSRRPAVECVVCPPYVYLSDVARLLRGYRLPIALGAQDVSAEAKGAFTGRGVGRDAEGHGLPVRDRGPFGAAPGEGEMTTWSPASLMRRARKLVPILCVGERSAEREAGPP